MTWWQRLFHRRRMEEQLHKELSFHLDQQTSDLIARGHHPAEARRQAAVAFGGPEQIKEECRDARGTRSVEDLLHDFRYSLRTLRHHPGFTAVAVLTLALGTGATTVMFTVINGVLLKPMHYPEPDRLVRIDEQTKGIADYRWGDRWAFAYPNFVDLQGDCRSLDMAAWRYNGGTISGTGDPEYVDGLQVSPELFPLLGVTLQQGRSFLPEENRPGAAPVIIISYGLWRRRFGASPAAVGMPLTFDGRSYTVVGVAPPDIGIEGMDVFTPIGQNTQPAMRNREAHPGIKLWARLRPGMTLAAAQSELDVMGRRLAVEYPKSNSGRGFIAEQLRPDVGDVRPTLWLLLGAVSLVLLIACANVASLLLARAVSRGRELAMRSALGASRGRLTRQCLTESAVLGLLGCFVGVLLAALGIHPFITFWPGSLPRADRVELDWHVLLFALAISIASSLLFGLAPALRSPARDLEQTLRAGSRTGIPSGSRRLHSAFVATEIAMAMVLLSAAGMLGHTLIQLSQLHPGVDIHNVLTARMALSPSLLANPERMRAAWQDVLAAARRVPGVEAVATIDTVPMRQGNNQLGYWRTPAEPPRDQKPLALANCVSPDYLKVMRLSLDRGRFFDNRDRVGSEPVIVIDEVMAQHAFPGLDAVGQSLSTDMGPARVIGIVGHVRYWGLAADDDAVVRDQFYYPFAQVPDALMRRWSELMSISVRTNVAPLSVVAALRHELRGAAGDQVVYEVRTLEQLERSTLARQRFLLLLFGIFAGLALVLASIGIYGVLAYVTSQRIPEIGVRMALGASPGNVVRLVLRQSLSMIIIGVAFGVAGAFAAGRILDRLVQGMRPTEFVTLAAMICLLVAAALLASFVPARRASRIDPTVSLRQD